MAKKVVHVHLIGKRKDYYFSSISAVFLVLSREDIGVSKHWLLNAGLPKGHVVCNSRAVIKMGNLISCPRQPNSSMETNVRNISKP